MMRLMKPDKEISVSTIRIPAAGRAIPALVLSPKTGGKNAAGILWIHGGGYIAGMKEMVHTSRAVDLVRKFGAVVVSPGYRLAVLRPYPAAAEDCYSALIYMKNHVRELGIRRDQIMVGGESAGGGLCAAVCLMARDRASVNIAFHTELQLKSLEKILIARRARSSYETCFVISFLINHKTGSAIRRCLPD